MARFGAVLRKSLIWSYERGTLPYDIICGLILAFIFFTPRSCFLPHRTGAQKSGAQTISTLTGHPETRTSAQH
jgi:hypothetical protein